MKRSSSLTFSMIKQREKAQTKRQRIANISSLSPLIFILLMLILPLTKFLDNPELTKHFSRTKRYTCTRITSQNPEEAPQRLKLNKYYDEDEKSLKAFSIYFTNPWESLNSTLIYQDQSEKLAYYFYDSGVYNIDRLEQLSKNSYSKSKLEFKESPKTGERKGLGTFSFKFELEGIELTTCADLKPVSHGTYWNRQSFRKLNWIYSLYVAALSILFCIHGYKSGKFPIMSMVGGNTAQIIYIELGSRLDAGDDFFFAYFAYFFINIIFGFMTNLKHKEIDSRVLRIIFIIVLPVSLAIYAHFFMTFHLHFATCYLVLMLISGYSFIDCFFYLKNFRLYILNLALLLLQSLISLNIYDGFGLPAVPCCLIIGTILLLFLANLGILVFFNRKVSGKRNSGREEFDGLDMRDFLNSISLDSGRNVEERRKKSEDGFLRKSAIN